MSHFDSCQLTLIWLGRITLNYWQPTESPAWRSFVFMLNCCATYYISLYAGAKRLVFHQAREMVVIISSGCLILTAVKLIILVRMAHIIDMLVSRCAKSIVTCYIDLHEVCVRVGGWAYATS